MDRSRYGEYKNIGGTPRVVDVGTAGEQVMAVQLLRIAKDLAAQVAVMAQAQYVQDWIALHPDETTRCALVTEIPTDLLRRGRNYPKDPPRAGATATHQQEGNGRVKSLNAQEQPAP